MSAASNLPIPDQLAAVREQKDALETREKELRRLLLDNPDLRTGASYVAVIKTLQRQQPDITQLRLAYPDIVAEHTHAVEYTQVDLMGVSSDGELVPLRQFRKLKAE